jgi:hypothetical protein
MVSWDRQRAALVEVLQSFLYNCSIVERMETLLIHPQFASLGYGIDAYVTFVLHSSLLHWGQLSALAVFERNTDTYMMAVNIKASNYFSFASNISVGSQLAMNSLEAPADRGHRMRTFVRSTRTQTQ